MCDYDVGCFYPVDGVGPNLILLGQQEGRWDFPS